MAIKFDTATLQPSTRLGPDHASWVYNGLDCCLTSEIRLRLRENLADDEPNVRETYDTAMSKLAPVGYMNMTGLRVDGVNLRETIKGYKTELAILNRRFDILCEATIGYTVNWRSPVQLKDLFYGVFKLKAVRKRNAQGFFAPTVNADALERFQSHYYIQVFSRFILAMREIGKKLSFLQTEHDKDGRIRTTLNIAGTDTGRFSSSFSAMGTGSNLQNVENKLRRPFVPEPGNIFVNVDLEQADARGLGARVWEIFYESHGAAEAGRYLDACESGDLHTTVCSMAFKYLDWPDPWDLKKAKAIAEQPFYRQYSYRDMSKRLGHGCLTEDHEVLTRKGWVPISEKPGEILQWSEQGSAFREVSNWVDKPYSGDLITFEGSAIDLTVTGDHKVVYTTDYAYKVAPARALTKSAKIPLGSGYVGGNEKVPAKLIAAVISDGNVIGNKTRFNLRKQRKIERLKALCKEADVPIKQYADGTWAISFTHTKKLGSYTLNWTADCIKDFVEEYSFWDGTRVGKTRTLFSTDVTNLIWLQTLGRLVGTGGNFQMPNISGFGSPVYRLQQNRRQFACTFSRSTKLVENVRVLCPTVPSGFFYVRRKNKISVTGNTNFFGTPPTMAMHTKTEVGVISKFQVAYFSAFPLIGNYDKKLDRNDWHSWVYYQLKTKGHLTNLFGRRRIFFDRYKDLNTLRKAIAYEPQSLTGEFLDRGWLKLWQRMPEARLVIPVHDSILFQLPYERLDELLPKALSLLKVSIWLKGDREFTIPLEAKTGYNWADAKFNKKTGMWDNPRGLKVWEGKDERKPEQPRGTVHFLDRRLD